jgi:hypothetical protein
MSDKKFGVVLVATMIAMALGAALMKLAQTEHTKAAAVYGMVVVLLLFAGACAMFAERDRGWKELAKKHVALEEHRKRRGDSAGAEEYRKRATVCQRLARGGKR